MRPSPARRLPAIVTILALAACGSKEEPPPAPGVASATEPTPAAKPASPPRPAPEAIPAPPIAGLPEACNEYRETIQRLARCGDAIPPATRENLQKNFGQQWAGWAKLPEPDRQTLAGICKSSSETVKEAAKDLCGW